MLARVHDPERARRRFGALLDALVPWLEREDPAADAVVATAAKAGGGGHFRQLEEALARGPQRHTADEVVALLEEASARPRWLDEARLARGGDALFRAGPAGGLVLAVKSLVCGYAAPAGNKPLVMSGQLQARAARRLSETGRFVEAVCAPGGMDRFGDGFAVALKVRLIHARVRLLCRRSGDWCDDLWGAPINQHDMLSTVLLFSSVLLDGLRDLGLDTPDDMADDYLHLWSYVGHVMGVDRSWLPLDREWASTLWGLIQATQAPPDDDSRALTRALLSGPAVASMPSLEGRLLPARVAFGQGLARFLLGDELADGLDLPRQRWSQVLPLLSPVLASVPALLRLPGGDAVAAQLGRRYWRSVVRTGLADEPARFEPPASLGQPARA